MHPVVHYRLLPQARMPHGHASIALTPDGRRLVAFVDAAFIDPKLAAPLAGLSTEIMRSFTRCAVPSPASRIRVRVHRVSDVGGGLVAAEVTPTALDILVERDLIRPELSADLGAHGTQIMRHFA